MAAVFLMVIAGLASSASAQTRPPVRPAAAVQEPLSFKPFFVFSVERFAAEQTFKGAFGSAVQPLFGGGLDVRYHHLFVDFTVLYFSKTGERAFVSDGEAFPLGIPLTATLTPIEIAAGYRFTKPRRRIVPYIGGGIGTYGYSEESDFSDGDDVDARHIGYLALGGVDVRMGRWISLSGDFQYTHVPGIFGEGGTSKLAGEDDLGGMSVRFRVLFGR